ncbi:MAG: site-2 protease family protein [Candidatus Binatia bacterium]
MKEEIRAYGWTLPHARERRRRPWLNIVLFTLTLVTTTMAGALQNGVNPLVDPRQITSGLPFALTLMIILLVHEMGHYLMARYHGVRATLPYFIPAPSFIGTFGAFIKMESPPLDRRSLFDVGAAGPLAGLMLAIPAVIIGLHLSAVSTDEGTAGGIILGSSILLELLSQLTLGFLPDEANITMHPIGFAGWIGLFVTALNLLPVGQLDGGHVTYALFGQRHIWVSRLSLVVILLLGFVHILGLIHSWEGWLIWGLLLLFMGVRHPPPLDPYTPLDLKRKILGWFVLAVLTLTFIPAPFSFHQPKLRREQFTPKPARPPLEAVEARAGQVDRTIHFIVEDVNERSPYLEPILHHHYPSGSRALHL